MPVGQVSPSRFWRFEGGFGIWRYSSIFNANARGDKTLASEAGKVYNFKKYGYNRAEVKEAAEQLANAVGCDRIVATPGHTSAVNMLQQVFGVTVRRVADVASRKYNHGATIDYEAESQTVEVPADFTARKVLVVDEVATTGKSLQFWRRFFEDRGIAVECLAVGVSRKLNPQPCEDFTYHPAQAQQTEPQTVAERVAKHVSRRNDIGELPEVKHPRRKALAVKSLTDFAAAYCGDLFERDPSAKLADYAQQMQAAIEGAGQIHIRMARGAGKTTWVKAALAWGLVTGRLHYAVVFAASAQLSTAIISDVWDIFEFDENFSEDFPEVAYPIRKAGGLPQRFPVQRYHGVKTQIRKSSSEIRLPKIDGKKSSGGLLMARGAGSKTRGLVRGKRRPDFVLLDDLQSREDAQNPERARKLSAWIDGDVQGLAGSRLLNAVMTSTPIVAGDLSEQYADAEQHPGWKLVEYRLLDGEPVRPELWEEYGERWKRARQSGDMAFREATAFYAAHRAEMDAGLDVLDPGKFDARLELSGIQHAWNQRLTMGETAFRAEYQLEPVRENVALELEARDVQRALNGSPRGVLPPGTLAPVAFVDVMGDQLHYTVAAFGPRQTAAVIDYGRFPDKGRATPRNAPERDVEAALARSLLTLADRLYSTPYRRADGRETRLHALWMDCGWQQATVHRVAALLRNRGHANTWGCRGYASTGYAVSSRYIVIPGDLVDMRERDGQRWAAQNSDAFREATQRAFLGVPLAPGSLSVWGRDPAEHADYAAHVTAERLTDKAVSERGVTLYRWALRPGALNHWLDSTSGCIAMAAFYRFWTAEDVPREAARAIGATVPARTARARRPRIYSARKTSR